ncbi:MAG: 2-amino-4-hydroxy-6-hydroxymethyldihydropteridine diphosphokinase [Syntrophomonadaceae bacterium]|nr:2-amino-4-hydroxy-6-hydroxymethyldihydropteridine diphosphokinase [Syntrophomonadaceae bacterium]
MQNTAYLGLGSNMGHKRQNLEYAIEAIDSIEGINVTKCSSFYDTEPWGKTDQEYFLNAVIEIITHLPPQELLKKLQEIEIKMGRQRLEKWGPRNIDIDILLYGDEVLDGQELKVPHPHMRHRLFVLIPLREINSAIKFPDDGMDIEEVLIRAEAREETKITKT